MAHNKDIKLAIKDLKSQDVQNISKTAEKYGMSRTTLSDRFKGKSTSYSESRSIYQKLLTNTQEEVLLQHISDLTDCRLPPTPQILKNLVIEII